MSWMQRPYPYPVRTGEVTGQPAPSDRNSFPADDEQPDESLTKKEEYDLMRIYAHDLLRVRRPRLKSVLGRHAIKRVNKFLRDFQQIAIAGNI